MFLVTSFVSLAFAWERKKEKEHHISLPLHTIATMNTFFATFAFPPPLFPLPPLSPSDVILFHHHLCRHPLPPCSKEQPRMTTGTRRGSALSMATVTCPHCHYLSHSLSGAAFGGAWPWPQIMARINAHMAVHHTNNRVAAIA